MLLSPVFQQAVQITDNMAAPMTIQKTKSLRLSLGDRACLTLAIAIDAPVYTTDQLWKKLKLGITIYLLR